MPVNVVLATKGRSEPIVGLIDQGNYGVQLGDAEKETLAKRGWTEGLTRSLEADVRELERRNGARAQQKVDSKRNTMTEAQARSEGKAYKRTLDLAFDDLVASARTEGRELGVTADAIDVGQKIGRKTAVLSEYLGRVRPTVEKLRAELAPYFEGQDPVAKLDEVKAALDGAQSTQELSIAQLPQATQELYELKGRVIAAIEKQNRIGKIAFAGQAAKIALFNKDLLLRARKTERDTGEGDPQI